MSEAEDHLYEALQHVIKAGETAKDENERQVAHALTEIMDRLYTDVAIYNRDVSELEGRE